MEVLQVSVVGVGSQVQYDVQEFRLCFSCWVRDVYLDCPVFAGHRREGDLGQEGNPDVVRVISRHSDGQEFAGDFDAFFVQLW